MILLKVSEPGTKDITSEGLPMRLIFDKKINKDSSD